MYFWLQAAWILRASYWGGIDTRSKTRKMQGAFLNKMLFTVGNPRNLCACNWIVSMERVTASPTWPTNIKRPSVTDEAYTPYLAQHHRPDPIYRDPRHRQSETSDDTIHEVGSRGGGAGNKINERRMKTDRQPDSLIHHSDYLRTLPRRTSLALGRTRLEIRGRGFTFWR